MSAALDLPCDTETPDTTRDAKGRFASADPWVRIRHSEVAAMNDDLADADAAIAHLSSENTRLEREVSEWMANNRECLAALSAAQKDADGWKQVADALVKAAERDVLVINGLSGEIDRLTESRVTYVSQLKAENMRLSDLSDAMEISEAWEWMALGTLMGALAVGIIVAAWKLWL